MGPTVAWILRPGGASLIGALALACLALPTGVAHAASGGPILQPDAPPTAVLVAPTPDPPAARAPAPVVGRAPTVVRPTLRAQSGNATASHPATRTQPKHATAVRTHAASSTKRKAATAPVAVLHRGARPDSVGAFLAVPIVKASEGGLARGAIALAGMLLAFVALGGGCLTVAVGRVEQER